MPYYDTPAFYVDFAQLPPPAVIETIAYEDILTSYRARVLAANPKLAAALKLEQSATNIILETEAYGEMILRARINAAARAVMLAFATGTDLDTLAAFYNVLRAVDPDGTPERDARFRRRVQLDAETFSTAGTAGSYIAHALAADPTIFDVSAIKINAKGGVKVTVMNSVADPVPTPAQITNVATYLGAKNRKVLTDVVSVSPPKVITTALEAQLTLYPGPDEGIVLNQVATAVKAMRARVAMLGFGLERSTIITALNQEGVQNVNLIAPAVDIDPGPDGCVTILSPSVGVLRHRTF